jgi:hypothetical protein
MSDMTAKDAEQDSKLAVLESKLESMRERVIALEGQSQGSPRLDAIEDKIKSLDEKIRKNEIWIQRAAAVIGASITVIGLIIAIAANAQEVNYGSNDPTKSEELLQLPSYRN